MIKEIKILDVKQKNFCTYYRNNFFMANTRRMQKGITNKKRTQRQWKMRGCASRKRGGTMKGVMKGGMKGGCGCGLQSGGKKRMVGNLRVGKQMGGNHLALSPAPFVNKPWLPPIQAWPGVQGSGTGNWLTKNQMDIDVTDRTAVQERGGQIFPMQMGGKQMGGKQMGGKQMRRNSRKKHGGNLGENIYYGINTAYNNLVGATYMPVNPLPTYDQFAKP